MGPCDRKAADLSNLCGKRYLYFTSERDPALNGELEIRFEAEKDARESPRPLHLLASTGVGFTA